MIVYDAPDAASDFYTRFTQRLVSALSAPTEEGLLYDVDMQLRPSGSAGPVAVRLSSFERYYAQEAWTWELLALTRLRVVAGDAALGRRVEAVRETTLAAPRDAAKVCADAADMRARMARERPASGAWDLKLAPGGFVDIEFIAQTLQLLAGRADVLSPNTGEALARLAATGALEPGLGQELNAAWTLYSDLQQTLRVCVSGAFAPENASETLKRRLAALGQATNFAALDGRIKALEARTHGAFELLVARPADGNSTLAR